MAKNEVKWGAILSYILIFLNSIYGLVIMPFVLDTIGPSEYGVYKTIAAMTSTISVMELGLGGTMQKFIAQYRAQNEQKKAFNFSAMCSIQAVIISLAMGLVGFALFFTLDFAYGASFTPFELARAKQIYAVLILYVMLHIFENVLFGIISGYNRFVFSNSVKLATLAFKVLLYFIVLPIFATSLSIVIIYLFIEILIIAIEFLYVKLKLKHKIKLYQWDNVVFKETFAYTILLFIQSIIVQLNGNIDNIVIGAVIGTTAVTVYSFAIQMFNMYETCSTSISGVVLPSVTNLIYKGATPKDLEDMVIKFGRAQWAVMGVALGGFISLGKEFFECWLGAGFEDCYYLSLILMIPVSFSMIVNTGIAILKVKNLLWFRTASLAYSAIINLILTIVGTHFWGYWAAASGTAISIVIGSVISLNVYYHVKLKMNMLRVYYQITKKITVCVVIPCLLCFALNNYIYGGWISFLSKAAIFVAVYAVLMLFWGYDTAIKKRLLKIKNKV